MLFGCSRYNIYLFTVRKQTNRFGGDKELYNSVIGKCGLSNKHAGIQLSTIVRFTDISAGRNGKSNESHSTGICQHWQKKKKKMLV